KKYGLRGAAIGGSVGGDEISDPKFHPFWAKAEQLGVVVFIHPQGTGAPTQLGQRFKGNGYLENVIGNPLETTIALSHLIFEGTLDKFPGLKICGAHGGGFLPSYSGRSDTGCFTRPDRCPGGPWGTIKKKPSEYLKQLYFDTMVFNADGLRHLAAVAGSGQLVVGTDFPYPWTKTAVDHVVGTPGLTDDEKVAILGGTAARLLGIKTYLREDERHSRALRDTAQLDHEVVGDRHAGRQALLARRHLRIAGDQHGLRGVSALRPVQHVDDLIEIRLEGALVTEGARIDGQEEMADVVRVRRLLRAIAKR